MRTLSGALMVGIAMLGFGRIAMGDFIPNAITGVTAYAGAHGDGLTAGTGSPQDAVNGSGLTVAETGTTYAGQYVHGVRWEDNWQSYAAPGSGLDWFMLDLGKSYSNLDKAWIWNVREVIERGAKNVDVYYAVSPTTVPATDNSYDFTASGSGWTKLVNTTIAQATSGGELTGYSGHYGVGPVDTKIDLSGISGGARYIAFVINSNYGDTTKLGGGFAEIQVTTIPEPTSMVMLSGGIIALLAYAWRKRR